MHSTSHIVCYMVALQPEKKGQRRGKEGGRRLVGEASNKDVLLIALSG